MGPGGVREGAAGEGRPGCVSVDGALDTGGLEVVRRDAPLGSRPAQATRLRRKRATP